MSASLRILVAEDDALAALALRSSLEELGHTVIGPAYTGTQALELFAGQPVDLAILDVRIPELDGFGVARAIAQTRPVPLIFLTGYPEDASFEATDGLPVFHFMIKPVGPEDLGPAIAVARRRFDEWQRLSTETARIAKRLDERKVVEQAKGLLMEVRGLSENDAYVLLRRESQNRNQPMAEIARTLLDAGALLRDPLLP